MSLAVAARSYRAGWQGGRAAWLLMPRAETSDVTEDGRLNGKVAIALSRLGSMSLTVVVVPH